MAINNRLNIPTNLIVGFQKRSDTYTGKLAYVTYYKEERKKKVIAKELSWTNWRDKKIDPLEIDNVPTEGFVLNKHVGGYKSGWNFRNSYCRIYDPRGFEFEISIENLLYILEYYDCIKGKGLIGKCVYAWDGKDLVLLPCSAPEYQESIELAKNIKEGKPTNKTIKVGSLYKSNENENLVYVGRYNCRKIKYAGYSCYGLDIKRMFIFYNVETKQYKDYSTLSKIDFLATEDYFQPHEMTDIIDNYLNSFEGYDKDKKIVDLVCHPTEETVREYMDRIIKDFPNQMVIRIFLFDENTNEIRRYSYYRVIGEDFEIEKGYHYGETFKFDKEIKTVKYEYKEFKNSDLKMTDKRMIPYVVFEDGKEVEFNNII